MSLIKVVLTCERYFALRTSNQSTSRQVPSMQVSTQSVSQDLDEDDYECNCSFHYEGTVERHSESLRKDINVLQPSDIPKSYELWNLLSEGSLEKIEKIEE